VTRVFLSILEICDKIVLQQHTELGRKFNALTTKTVSTTPGQYLVARLIKLFLSTSEKIIWVNDVDEMSEALKARLPRHDVYLVQLCLKTEDKILVTTDATLYQNLIEAKDILGIIPVMAEDFVNAYLNTV